jgi:hypothetical protein
LLPLFPASRTHFIGFLQGAELAAVYASADYFVYASVSETFGQVYLEAMSSGTPIIAAEGQQMKEFFVNGKHGYTWQPGSVSGAIEAYKKTKNDREAIAEECRKSALNHSWDAAANQIADVYKSLVPKTKHSTDERSFFYLRKSLSSVYYLSIWLFEMILVLLFMVPFMKVSKPVNNEIDGSNNKKTKIISDNRSNKNNLDNNNNHKITNNNNNNSNGSIVFRSKQNDQR